MLFPFCYVASARVVSTCDIALLIYRRWDTPGADRQSDIGIGGGSRLTHEHWTSERVRQHWGVSWWSSHGSASYDIGGWYPRANGGRGPHKFWWRFWWVISHIYLHMEMVASQVLPAFYNRFAVCVISCFNTSTVLPGWSLCILNRSQISLCMRFRLLWFCMPENKVEFDTECY